MPAQPFEKLIPADKLSKRERVERTLRHQSVDRAALLEQLSYNPGVIAMYTGEAVHGFDYTIDDICCVIRQTTDLIMPPSAPRGTEIVTTADGLVMQNDNWTSWHISRPFKDEQGARDWLLRKTAAIRDLPFDAAKEKQEYQDYMLGLQAKIGATVILNFSFTGFCTAWDSMGLEIFTFFQAAYPEVLREYMQVSTAREVARIHAVADPALSPVILIPEDFSTKQGPIFAPRFLKEFHYPYIQRLVEAWHAHGVIALYHSDGNYKKVIPDLIATGVDGFYCLEPNCGMDVVALKQTWPEMVWAGGVDGVDLMERGTPEQVRAEVHRHIRETGVLQNGGMFVATSSEINPPIPAENFRAMVNAVGEFHNPEFNP